MYNEDTSENSQTMIVANPKIYLSPADMGALFLFSAQAPPGARATYVCVCVCMCVCVCVCVCVCLCACEQTKNMHRILRCITMYNIRMYIYVCMFTYIFVCLHIFVHITGASTCSGSLCAVGKYGQTGATSAAAATCATCPAGTYSAAAGASVCTEEEALGTCGSALYDFFSGLESRYLFCACACERAHHGCMCK